MARMNDQPKLTPEQAAEVGAAIRDGNYVVSHTRCYPCQFGEHDDQPHTWMNAEDREHAGVSIALTAAEMADEHPCGCHCNQPGRRRPGPHPSRWHPVIHIALVSAYPTEADARMGIAEDLHVVALGQFRGSKYLGVWTTPPPYSSVVHVFAHDTDADDLQRRGWTRP